MLSFFVATAIGLFSYVFVLSAMRPFTPLLQSVRVTLSEDYLAVLISLVVFIAVFVRLFRGAKVKEEVDRVLDLDGE
ncbi:hypothetical protein ABT364_18675 [Massilia sp. SR12]